MLARLSRVCEQRPWTTAHGYRSFRIGVGRRRWLLQAGLDYNTSRGNTTPRKTLSPSLELSKRTLTNPSWWIGGVDARIQMCVRWATNVIHDVAPIETTAFSSPPRQIPHVGGGQFVWLHIRYRGLAKADVDVSYLGRTVIDTACIQQSHCGIP
jgi:hypothetical protein